ncbi:hypothetical protein B0T16DRAFT_330405 [Cercophora newfieldiana]|uniref:MIF4G domain-containing protein n=1 Tax=Cercophora newfieldiana TaxID=92897 RepID=A0AA39Y4X5_9PEZI|nr:hypothetical protein B0T16DRAFT_330405 [Cercophora newfieldiana]
MTSSASQQNQNPATTPSAPAATSYASAAGATKKPTSTPLIATGSHPPVVVGSSAPAAQNGKSSASPVNGRPNITPAVPAVAGAPPIVRGSSIMNGGPGEHARKSSVTISANAPSGHIANGGPVGGNKAIPQFGFNESPAVTHSTPQTSGAVPIPIPGGNPRITSPAHSPSPIPQIPQQSGGQRAPSSTQPPPTFGSFPGENDRHMKQHSISHPAAMGSPHARRDSQASAHSEAVGHGGSGHNRGGYQGQGGRGRGGFNPQYNNPNNMGYPPSRQFQNPNAGRGGMQSYHQGRGGMPTYQGSPQPPRASPAPTPALPHHGTPTMAPAALASNPAYYSPNMNMYPHQQVKPPFITNDPLFKQGKKSKAMRRESNKNFHQSHHSSQKPSGNEPNHKTRRNSKRWDMSAEFRPGGATSGQPTTDFADGPAPSYAFAPSRAVPMQPPSLLPPSSMSHLLQGGSIGHIDLSPASGNFEQLLTEQHKQMNPPYGVVPPPMEGYRGNMMMPNYYGQQMPYMGQPQQPNPAFHQPFIPPSYNQGQAAAPAMSRNPSQVSDRPTSSTGQNQAPAIAQGTPHQRAAQPAAAPAIVSSSGNFTRPKKTAAVVIKDAQGKIIDLSAVKAPASPSPSIQQSKTPPVIASTPTPPPKPATPSHARSESASVGTKSIEQVRNEFKKAVQMTTEGPTDTKAKEDDVAKAAAEEKGREEERVKEEERVAAEKKAAEEAKAAEEKAEAEAKAKAEAKAAEDAAKEAEEKKLSEDEELERMIREMEEEDARREAEQEEISKKKKAEAEERKKREEVDRLAKAAENDQKLREQEREMERIEEEKERKRAAGATLSVAEALGKKLDELDLNDKKDASKPASPAAGDSGSAVGAKAGAEKQGRKPVPLNLSPLNTKPVEAPQPSAALQSLKSSRFLPGIEYDIYPAGISSPNPALNQAVAKKGKVFKYDAQFLLQFQGVFTEQPSMEFHQQVKSLIGDSDGSRSASARTPGAGSARQGSRSGATGGFPQQGAMGQFGAKTLPPGTTSEQRFAMSQGSGSMPRPGAVTGMAFGRTGGFPGQLSRTPSSTNAAGIPNSPRQGSRRGGSKREFGGKATNEAQAAKTMPLTAGMELKPITTSASGWKPTSIGRPAAAAAVATPGHMDPAMVQRKVKAALNKMTPEKFDKISDGILEIASQSKNEQDGRTLRQVIQLTFEKATDEAHWASMYAKFCKRMLETMSPDIRDENILDKSGSVVSGGALFRKYLLNRCQEEFERGWKVDLPEMKDSGDKKAQEAALLSDEYYIAAAAKRRGLGLVQFIGELFKLGMLTERIMHECVRKLLEFQGVPDEAEIESLTKLLRTVGGVLDQTDKGRPMMEAYFQRIDTIINLPELPSRLKFMLMDIIDLRRANWHSKEANKGPKTLEEVRAEAEALAAQKAAESARNSQRGGPGGRPPAGRGDSRNFSQYSAQQPPNQVQMDDLRRLKATGSRTSSQNASFGPSSMFNSRSNSGRRLAPGGAFGRGGEDSGASSRTGTPPTRDSVAHTNAFGLLADTGENPASPPSTAASPALSKAALDTVVSGDNKKE